LRLKDKQKKDVVVSIRGDFEWVGHEGWYVGFKTSPLLLKAVFMAIVLAKMPTGKNYSFILFGFEMEKLHPWIIGVVLARWYVKI